MERLPAMPGKHDRALGAAVRELRSRQQLTIEALAHEAGMTTATLSKLELAQSNPRWSTIRAVVEALGGDFAELGRLIGAARETSGR